MNRVTCDVLVLGGGFSGSLAAMLLARTGHRVVLVERDRHPRFAIGESSTPAADLLLRHLGERYDLPELVALSSYGRWQDAHPELGCGPKRGFAYFAHDLDRPFTASGGHTTELLVEANTDLGQADLQWLRQDVDRHLADLAAKVGVGEHDETTVTAINERAERWEVRTRSRRGEVVFDSGLLLDATGPAHVLGTPGRTRPAPLRTDTRAIFAHFAGVQPWAEVLERDGIATDDYPFAPDQGTVHHLFDGGWMWQIRFDDDTTSAGFVIDNRTHPPVDAETPGTEWRRWLQRLPSVARQFRRATVARPDAGLVRRDRVQWRRRPVAGTNWALLPNTAGFVDPLHSTGIAQSILGITRLVGGLEPLMEREARTRVLADYATGVDRELDLIDELVSSFHACPLDTRLAATWPYFVAATRWEHRFRTTGEVGAYLDASDHDFVRMTSKLCTHLHEGTASVVAVREQLRPYDVVGVLETDVPNVHRHDGSTK